MQLQPRGKLTSPAAAALTLALLCLPVGRLPEAVRLMKDVEDDLVVRRVEG